MASFTKEVNLRLAKRLLVFNERLANRGLTSLVKEAIWASFTEPAYAQLCQERTQTASLTYKITILPMIFHRQLVSCDVEMTPPSHYLDKYYLIIKGIPWHLPDRT